MMIPYARQEILPEDIAAVTEVLNSDFLTQGPAISAFENAVRSYCGAGHAVAVTSATAALPYCLQSFGTETGRTALDNSHNIRGLGELRSVLWCGC